MNLEEARKVVNEGKKVVFHHNGQLVLVNKDTNFKDLQWQYFGLFGLTWNNIFNGVYSLAKYITIWNNSEKPFEDINEATQFAEEKAAEKRINTYVYGVKDGLLEEEPFMSCTWEM